MPNPNFIGTGLGGGTPVALQETAQAWPAAFTTTDPGGVTSWTWSAPDGSDRSADLTGADGDLIDYFMSCIHVVRGWSGAGGTGNVLAVHEITLGDTEGWCDVPADEGTLVNPSGYWTARSAGSLTVQDTVQAAGSRSYTYWALSLPGAPGTMQTRVFLDAATQGSSDSTIVDIQVTDDLAALDGSGYTLAAGVYVFGGNAFMRIVLRTSKDGTQANAGYFGTQSSLVMGPSQEVAGYYVACPLDASGDPMTGLGHKEVAGIGVDYSTPANLYIVLSSYSLAVTNGGTDKLLGFTAQVRIV